MSDQQGSNAGMSLSEAQLAIWLHEQLHPDSRLYHLTHTIELFDVDASRWEAAVAFVADQQPAHRTTIAANAEGAPTQVVAEAPSAGMVVHVDAQALDEQEITDLVRAATDRPFDLACDPLYRMTLIAASDGRHVMVAQAHHIISDLWSLSAWLDAVARRYRSDTKDRKRTLRVTPGSHAVAEAEWLQTEEAQTQLDYWLERTTDLPKTELPHSARSGDGGGAITAQPPVSANFTHGQTSALKEIADAHDVDLPDLVMTCLGIVLARYGSTDDVVLGTLRARRSSANARTMGMFANELLLRLAIDDAASIGDAMRSVQRASNDAATHDRLPLSTILRAAREQSPDSGLVDRPPFDVSFGWQAMGRQAGKSVISALALGIGGVDGEIAGMQLRTRTPIGLIAHAPLTFVGAVFDDQLHLTATYQEHLVSELTATQVLDHLVTVLSEVASGKVDRVSDIAMISGAERATQQRLLTGPVAPIGGTIIDRFHAAVERDPQRRALRDHERSLTYAEVNAEVEQVASMLTKVGVRSGDYVGVQLAASSRVPITLLAILRCGAAYVPIDPRYPTDRREYMLSDSGAAVVVVDQHSDTLDPSITHVVLNDAWAEGPLPSAARYDCAPDDDAYLIYTSGSTGRPKGVRQTHRTLSNLMESLQARPGFGPQDCLVAVASLSFDISVVEQLLPLAAGGELYVADPDVAQDAEVLSALLVSANATIFQGTPATWRILIASGWEQPDLVLWSQAEELTPTVAGELRARARAVWNLYGPTETHDCTVAEVTNASLVSLGTAINNTRLDIVDQQMRSVPVGCRGELLVAGAGLANGYLGRGELTNERFIDRDGERWYRTGDLVALLDDGTLRCDGRTDHQVKLRGFRIELGEIEAAIERHSNVSDAVVTLYGPGTENPRLVAYVVAREGLTCEAEALHGYLSGSLPTYMIPAAIEILDAIPRLPNQKIDRKQLPVPAR